MWFCAVRSADLDRPGIFRTVQVGRENVIITRTRGGDLRAFLNVCRHRGSGCARRSPARSGTTSSARITHGRTTLTAS
ncbi:Rieske 2Fe-2S domain-containing protein [Streptomyces sp. NPDC002888]|uniref:Rieske 2Fe-2S domain-containing protein n=1 Tax=Streptomyces sp. NPDC002888 TaxID=3364668 RepID=UPI003675C3CD